MTTIATINGKNYQVLEIYPLDPRLPHPVAPDPQHDLPHFDEICIKFAKPVNGAQSVIVRLMSDGLEAGGLSLKQNDSIKLKLGSNEFAGTIAWLDNENPIQLYHITNLSIDYGFPVAGGAFEKANPQDYDIDPQKILEGLAAGWRIGTGGLLSAQNLASLRNEFLQKFGHVFWNYNIQATWDGPGHRGVKIHFTLVPPPKELGVKLEFQSTTPIPQNIQDKLIDNIKDQFENAVGSTKPITRQHYLESRIRVEEYFRTHDDFYLVERSPGPGQPPVPMMGDRLVSGGTMELKFILAARPKEAVLDVNGMDGKPIALSAYDQTQIQTLIKPPYHNKNIDEGMKSIVDYFMHHTSHTIGTKGTPPNVESGIDVVLGLDGKLHIELVLVPLPQSIAVNTTILETTGTTLKQYYDANHLLLPFPHPITAHAIKKYGDDLVRYYAAHGYLVQMATKKGQTGQLVYELQMIKAPTQVEIQSPLKPTDAELQKMFFHQGLGLITETSLREGLEALIKWFEDKGAVELTGSDANNRATFSKKIKPQVKIEGNRVIVTANPVKIDVIELQQWRDNKPQPMSERQQKNLQNEFSQKPGDIFSTKALKQTLRRLARYPHRVINPQEPFIIYKTSDNGIGISYRFLDGSLSENIPALRLNIGGSASRTSSADPRVNDDEWHGEVHGGATARLQDGREFGGEMGYNNNRDDEILSLHLKSYFPWIDDTGRSLRVGVHGAFVLAGDRFRNGFGAYGEVVHPFTKHSPWSYITSLGAQAVLDGDNDYDHTWFNPTGGFQYDDRTIYDDGTLRARLTGGPRISDAGKIYGEANLSASYKIGIGHGFYLELEGRAGVKGGDMESYQHYTSTQVLSGYFDAFKITNDKHSVLYTRRGTVHGGVSAHVMYDVLKNDWVPIKVGAGCTATVMGGGNFTGATTWAGCGVKVDIRGIQILMGTSFVHNEENGFQVSPFGISLGTGQ